MNKLVFLVIVNIFLIAIGNCQDYELMEQDTLGNHESLKDGRFSLHASSGHTLLYVDGYSGAKDTNYSQFTAMWVKDSFGFQLGGYLVSGKFDLTQNQIVDHVINPVVVGEYNFVDLGLFAMAGKNVQIVADKNLVALELLFHGGLCLSIADQEKDYDSEEEEEDEDDSDLNYGICGKTAIVASISRFSLIGEMNLKLGHKSAHFNTILGVGVNF